MNICDHIFGSKLVLRISALWSSYKAKKAILLVFRLWFKPYISDALLYFLP